MKRRSDRAKRRGQRSANSSRPLPLTRDQFSIDFLGTVTLGLTGFALPLAFDPSAALPFPIAKSAVLGLSAYALAALTLLKVIRAGFDAIPRTWLHVAVAVFLGTMAMASMWAVDVNIALAGAYDRRLGLVSYLQFGMLFLGASMFLRSDRTRYAFFMAVVAGGVSAWGYALAQRAGVDPIRWSGVGEFVFSTLGNSNLLGHYFAVLAAALWGSLASVAGPGAAKRFTTALAILSVAFALGAVMSGARAAVIGLGVGIMTAIALRAWHLRRRVRPSVLFGGIVAATAAIAGLLLVLTPAGARLLALTSGTDLSLSERSLLYQTIIEIVRERPILGVGPDNLAATYNAHRPSAALQFGLQQTQSSAHGWPWRLALDGGLVALFAFSAVLMTFMLYAARWVRRGDWHAAAVITAVATYMIAGIFSINDPGTDWLFWLASGLVAGSVAAASPTAARRFRWQNVIMISLTFGLLWSLWSASREIGSSRALRASQAAAGRDRTGALVQARKAVENDDRWPAHWNNLGLRALEADDRGLALMAFERAADRGVFDPFIWKNLGTLQAQLASGQPHLALRARRSAERAVQSDPNNPEAHVAAAQIYLVLGDAQSAALSAEVALDLAPKHAAALEIATVSYLRLGRLDDAMSAITRLLDQSETPQRRLLLARVHIARQEPEAAAAALRRVLEIDPKNQDAATLLQQIRR